MGMLRTALFRWHLNKAQGDEETHPKGLWEKGPLEKERTLNGMGRW